MNVIQVMQDIAAFCRAHARPVDFVPGWAGRGNGQTAAYEGGLVHHTASNSSARNPFPTRNVLINGRPGLSGPLCNWGCDWNGVLVAVAAHPANHAGASGGRSMGPLPVTQTFNRRVLGLEIDYAGISPMTPAQYQSAVVWGAAVAALVGRSDVQRVRAHAETSVTGKWDPGYGPNKTIDMARFRADVAAVLTGGDDVLKDDERNAVISVWRQLFFDTPGGADTTPEYGPSINEQLAKIRAAVETPGEGPAQLTDADHEAIAAKVAARLAERLQS